MYVYGCLHLRNVYQCITTPPPPPGLGLECSGFGINNKANRHITQIMQYWIIVNMHWIPTFELPSICHKRPRLLTYLFYCSENDLKLKEWINFGIYWKKFTFTFSALALALVLHVSGLGLLALAPLPLSTSLVLSGFIIHLQSCHLWSICTIKAVNFSIFHSFRYPIINLCSLDMPNQLSLFFCNTKLILSVPNLPLNSTLRCPVICYHTSK